MHALAVTAFSLLTAVEEQAPDDEDVVAGWMGFAVFIFLILAVALLGWSLIRHLRKADTAKEQGAYGDAPSGPDADPAGENGRTN